MNNRRIEFFRDRLPKYRESPVMFAKEVLSFAPDDWQTESLKAIALPEVSRIAIKSGQGVGKTGIEAVTLLWFLTCFPYPRVVATAPTRQQLNDVLWSEIAKWQEKSPLLKELLKWTKTYVYMKGYEKRWFAVARTATKPENMQGFHEDNMLFIIDEASGVADPIIEAILGTLSGVNNKLLMCGNPTKREGSFFDAFNADKDLYWLKTVSSEDSARTNKENIKALIRKYGYDSNVVRVRVRGEFPMDEDDVYIPYKIIERACMCEPEPSGKISLGVDVARYGNDETVIAENVFSVVALVKTYRGKDLMWTVGEIVQRAQYLHKKNGLAYVTVNIDDTGLGGGVTDRLREVISEKHIGWLSVNPVNAASRVPEEKTDNKGKEADEIIAAPADMTAYMWKNMRDLMEAQKIKIDADNELVGQLSSRKYSITSNGKIKLESKDDMKKRGLDSPDRADAVALALYPVQDYVNIPGAGVFGKKSYFGGR